MENSKLEKWLRDRNMTTNDFVKMIGCSRPTIWRAKLDKGISKHFAEKIIEITKGEIQPRIKNTGKRKPML